MCVVEDVIYCRDIVWLLKGFHLMWWHRHQLWALLAIKVDVNVVGKVRDFCQKHVSWVTLLVGLVAVLAVVHRWIGGSLRYLASAILVIARQVVSFFVVFDKWDVAIYYEKLVSNWATIWVKSSNLFVHFCNQPHCIWPSRSEFFISSFKNWS